MTEIEKLKEEIKQKQRELAKLMGEENGQPKYPFKQGETYYSVTGRGEIVTDIWLENDWDKQVYTIGNCFKTRAEAEFEMKCIQYTSLFKRYIKEHDKLKIDWTNRNQMKSYIYYDYWNSNIEIDWTYAHTSQNIYASNEQVLLDAIEFVGRDNVKKYVLRVEE